MQNVVLPAITFVSASCVAYYSTYISDKFHTLFFLIGRSWPVIFYSLIYGVVGVLAFYLLKDNVLQIADNNTHIKEAYIKAFSLGVAVKAIADINLFNVRTGGTSFPIGIRTFTLPLDRFFERQFNAIGFERSEKFLQPFYDKYAGKVADINKFKEDIISLLRRFYPDQNQVIIFIASDSLVKATLPDDVMRLVLNEFGETVFKKIFDRLTPA